MYIPKDTRISYRIVKVKNDKGVEEEMAMINKDVFEKIITMLGFEKEEQAQLDIK